MGHTLEELADRIDLNVQERVALWLGAIGELEASAMPVMLTGFYVGLDLAREHPEYAIALLAAEKGAAEQLDGEGRLDGSDEFALLMRLVPTEMLGLVGGQ